MPEEMRRRGGVVGQRSYDGAGDRAVQGSVGGAVRIGGHDAIIGPAAKFANDVFAVRICSMR